MSWNYRVIEHETKLPTGEKTIHYSIHEVYYTKKGKIRGWAEAPAAPLGDDLRELKSDLKYIQYALKAPVLRRKKGDKLVTVK